MKNVELRIKNYWLQQPKWQNPVLLPQPRLEFLPIPQKALFVRAKALPAQKTRNFVGYFKFQV